MTIAHYALQFVQFVVAILLILVVMSQTSKDQGMGGTLGGGGDSGGGSRYSGGYEEKMDHTARNLAFSFLIISFAVALVGHYVG